MVQAGSSYKITHDIVIGDQVAFRSGETVVVEDISPSPQKPEYQYVVLSQSLNQRFQLRDIDITEIAPSAPYPVTTVQESSRQISPQKTAPKRKWRATAIAMLIMLIIGAVGGFVLAKKLDSSSKKSTPSANQTSKGTTTQEQQKGSSTTGVSQKGSKPDLSKPDPQDPNYMPATGGSSPITKAQYDLLKGGMSEGEVRDAMVTSSGASYQPNTTTSEITLNDASRTVVPVIVCDWTIEGDPQGYVKAKLVGDKLVEKSWNPSTGKPSWEVY
jgi:hypothetical protein